MAVALSSLSAEPAADQAERELTLGRLTVTLGANALPAQIDIQAATTDLPLEHRGKDAPAPSPATLAAIGRGPQIAAPMRLEAIVQGKEVELNSADPASIENEKDHFVARATLTGGGVTAKLHATYTTAGAMHFGIRYSGGEVDSLSLAMRLQGPVDTVVSGAAPFQAADYSLPDDEGLLWGNAAPPKPAPQGPPPAINRGQPGVPSHLFWGNGNRGFTWLCENADGWTVTPVAASMTLSRDKTGVVTWRALLVNHPTKLKGEKTVSFTLLTHPVGSPAADRRKTAWVSWPYGAEALTPPIVRRVANTSGRKVGRDGIPSSESRVTNPAYEKKAVLADRASSHEGLAKAILLQGPAGGDARSAADTLADTYPLPIFRYLAGTHTGLPARLLTNSPKLTTAGRNPALDRMALGRALLHDIGFDPAGAAHLAMLGRLASGLAEFGLFEPDGQTEFIPYWRSGRVLRYGEPFSKDDAFEVTATDPMQRVHVCAWLRPASDGKSRKALILVVNEGEQPVREQLYLLDAKRLFGSANRITKVNMVDRWDMSAIPGDSDWSHKKLRGEPTGTTELGVKGRSANVPFLIDAEDAGGVALSVAVKGQEVYHRLYVPARGFRLLVGGILE